MAARERSGARLVATAPKRDLVPTPAVVAAARATGPLDAGEMEEFAARDIARGRQCVEPAVGRVAGITPNGELLVSLADTIAPFRSGSLVLEDAR